MKITLYPTPGFIFKDYFSGNILGFEIEVDISQENSHILPEGTIEVKAADVYSYEKQWIVKNLETIARWLERTDYKLHKHVLGETDEDSWNTYMEQRRAMVDKFNTLKELL